MSDGKSSTMRWIVALLLSTTISIAALWQGYEVAAISQETQKSLEISKVKLEIINSVKQYDRQSSEILFEHVLKPIDTQASFNKFRIDFLSLNSELAPISPSPAKHTQIISEKITSNKNIDYKSLVKDLAGDKRLNISDKLVLAYKDNPTGVVNSLINGLLPQDNKWSYRVNLYIAFTLARMEPSWVGSKKQLNYIKNLKATNDYKKDSTFRRRVDEALDNYSKETLLSSTRSF